MLYSEHCVELGIGGVVGFVLYGEHFLNFKFGHNTNISNLALLLEAGIVTDETPTEYNKMACLLLTVGES